MRCRVEVFVTIKRRVLGVLTLLVLSAVPGISAGKCPGSFATFIARFQADLVFQQTYTWSPLLIHAFSGDACYPDCPYVGVEYNKNEVRAFPEPIFPLLSTQRELGLVQRSNVGARRATVRVLLPDSDSFNSLYRFRRIEHCWYLVQANI